MARSLMEARMLRSIDEHGGDLAELCHFVASSDEIPVLHGENRVIFDDDEVLIVGVVCYLYVKSKEESDDDC